MIGAGGEGASSLVMQPSAVPEAPPPPLPPLELPAVPVVPALPVVPAVPVELEPAVPVLPPLELLQPPTDETLEIMKPAPARPRIPKNALILNSFIVFFSVRTRSCQPSPRLDWGRTLMPISTVA